MSMIKSLDELKQLRDKMKKDTDLRQSEGNSTKVLVSMATCGIAAGARATMSAITEEISNMGLSGITVTACGCMGLCHAEPTVEVITNGNSVLYGHVDAEKAKEIVQKHLKNGEFVQNLIVEKPY